jgi:GABA permease
MRSYLVVANRTLGGPQLVSEVLARSRAEPARFHVVVPATADHGHATWTEGAAHAQAQRRLEDALARLRDAGIEVTGEVGDENPTRAVGDVLLREPFDAIILSTLPPGASRWLKRDLPHRLARQHHLPVVHVVATSELVP